MVAERTLFTVNSEIKRKYHSYMHITLQLVLIKSPNLKSTGMAFRLWE